MPRGHNKLSRFWQELKRRNVIRVVAMYAGGAYVLIELANNVVAPLNLPDWTPRLVILIALVGFPVMVVLSWIFDITPEGIGRTESMEDAADQKQAVPRGKRKLKASDVIILVLIVAVGILIYPRIFRSGNLNAMTVPVTVINEYGEKETRRVFKEDYITRLTLFPFRNETSDTASDWMGYGILEAVLEDQLQFTNILTGQDDATRLNEQIAFAREGKYPYFLTGAYRVEGSVYEITARLYQTSNGDVSSERIYRGTDFFDLADSISAQARIDLGVSEVILDATPDLSISELMTDNLGAYENYIRSKHLIRFGGYSNINRAIQLDSTFAKAYYYAAYACFNFQSSHESAVVNISQAIRHRQRLSEFSDIETRILYNQIMGDQESVVRLLEYQYELRPNDINLLNILYDDYLRIEMTDRAEKVALRINELVPGHPPFQILLADSYLRSGKADKSLEVLHKILTDHPTHVQALLKLGEACLHNNDPEAAEEAFNKAIYEMPEKEKYWASLLDHIAYIRDRTADEEYLLPFVGKSRDDSREAIRETYIKNNQLFSKLESQRGLYAYPVSDTVAVTVFRNRGGTFDFAKGTYKYGNRGKAVRIISEQWSDPDVYIKTLSWIEDSLILGAKDLLASGRNSDALIAFREAYKQNPEHYYLGNYIRYLEFITGPEYGSSRTVFEVFVGSYEGTDGELEFQIRDERLFFTNQAGLIYELLPLSEERFMVPSIYELQLQIVRDQDAVSGLKYLYRDGREAFFSRIN